MHKHERKIIDRAKGDEFAAWNIRRAVGLLEAQVVKHTDRAAYFRSAGRDADADAEQAQADHCAARLAEHRMNLPELERAAEVARDAARRVLPRPRVNPFS